MPKKRRWLERWGKDGKRLVPESKKTIKQRHLTSSSKRRSSYKTIRPLMMEKCEGMCFWCSKPLVLTTDINIKNHITVDHLIPLCRGGTNAIENMVAACHRCNNKKQDKTESEWREWLKKNPMWLFQDPDLGAFK